MEQNGHLAPLGLPLFVLDPLWGSTSTQESHPLVVDVIAVRKIIVQERPLVWERKPGVMWGHYSRRRRIRLKTAASLCSIAIDKDEQTAGGDPIPWQAFSAEAAVAFPTLLVTRPVRVGQRVRITLSGRGTYSVLVLVELLDPSGLQPFSFSPNGGGPKGTGSGTP